MPYSQDYIKRMIEQFGEFLLALKESLVGDRIEEAREKLDLAYREVLGLDPKSVRDLPDDVLILNTAMSRVGDMDKSVVLGDLLIADGDLHEHTGDYDTAQQCYGKALAILIEALLRQPFGTAKEYVDRIDVLTDKAEQYDVPFDLRWRLFRYHERVNRYAAAEDDLFDLDELSPDNEGLIDEGAAFYERLLQMKDHELLLGGLPRVEVEEGLAAWQREKRDVA
jgi:tetratricopeptide (TPR) repeat protein